MRCETCNNEVDLDEEITIDKWQIRKLIEEAKENKIDFEDLPNEIIKSVKESNPEYKIIVKFL